MQCEEARPRLDAYVDDELTEAERAELRDHLADCVDCGPEAAALPRLRDEIRRTVPAYRAPEIVRSQIRFALRREAAAMGAPGAFRGPGWLAYAASILLAVAVGSGGTFLALGERQDDRVASEVIDSHLRSLLGTHLTDVASSDQHTVKPWFNGRLSFSPPVYDLAARGYPLLGGRLDFVGGQAAAALVYGRRQHMINVFVWPLSEPRVGASESESHGYHTIHWNTAEYSYWIASDLGLPELRAFAGLLQQSDSAGVAPER